MRRSIVVDSDHSNTIQDIKCKIHKNEGLDQKIQFLYHKQTLLDDKETLRYYNIQDRSRLSLSIKLKN